MPNFLCTRKSARRKLRSASLYIASNGSSNRYNRHMQKEVHTRLAGALSRKHTKEKYITKI